MYTDSTGLISKPDPTIATKYESHIMTCCMFLIIDSILLLIAGGLATRYFTSLYLAPLAAILSLFSAGILILLHRVKDCAWRKTLNENLLDRIYPPCSSMISILSNGLIMIVWYMAAFTTIAYHAALRAGKLQDVKDHPQGPLSSWGELSFTVVCTFFVTALVVLQVIQRRATSREMSKAMMCRELEY